MTNGHGVHGLLYTQEPLRWLRLLFDCIQKPLPHSQEAVAFTFSLGTHFTNGAVSYHFVHKNMINAVFHILFIYHANPQLISIDNLIS